MRSLFYLLMVMAFASCGSRDGQTGAENKSELMEPSDLQPSAATPEWAARANIYEVNVRQYTPAGTLEAFAKHLPRLKEMGVDILWFMPVYPISQARRKGSLGSYYAVSDYTAVNPAFGTMQEFKALVEQIQGMGMRVILDWVPNHTGWDHAWITEHPEYYTQDSLGNVIDPIDPKTGEPWGWTDVADLNYGNPELREAMIQEMLFWLEEVGVDGFRCDVAGEVPDDFWAQAVPRLREANPEIFMLAESDHPPHRNQEWFAMNYGWELHHLMNAIAQGERSPKAIDTVLAKKAAAYQRGYFMQFLTNHDENSWQGTIEERMGEAADAMAVLAFTINGMPLMYSGQEAGLNYRLKFFEKDTIPWNGFKKTRLYKTLLDLKHSNPALGNGLAGGALQRIYVEEAEDQIYAYRRKKGARQVVVFLNLSDEPQSFTLSNENLEGEYTNVFANSTVKLTSEMTMNLNPWSYLLLEQ
ncbi:MAG: alpha-amylase family glycosyl hydrolase [Phaeodactylibacter sp.]|uniref:alpha-amylase family glycosyl hydrolase n=1 Tax=Phaeodactylibacter sp. TaxID=1940289 RepID=UPI0032F04D7A